jgi:hypothetical protein
MITKGAKVRHVLYGYTGIVTDTFRSWEDLKARSDFFTIAPDASEMDEVEMLIHGDHRDRWLEMQDVAYTEANLQERWYKIKCLDGGVILSCRSRLRVVEDSRFEQWFFRRVSATIPRGLVVWIGKLFLHCLGRGQHEAENDIEIVLHLRNWCDWEGQPHAQKPQNNG